MRGENGLALNLQEVFNAIDNCDVMVLGFSHLTPRVLFDTRTGSGGPLFRVVRPVQTPAERFTQLRKLRPGLGDPERYLFVRWPLGLESLIELGVWERIVARCRSVAPERADTDCDGIMDRVRTLDRKEDHEAISGESYRNLWPQQQGKAGEGA